MKHYILIITNIFLCTHFLFGQDFDYKDKHYDFKIYESQMEFLSKNSISLEEYLSYSKPFSKMDARPLCCEKVWLMDTVYSSSMTPNFLWGSISNYFNLSEKEAMNKPNEFLEIGHSKSKRYKKHFLKNIAVFEQLINLCNKNSSSYFVHLPNLSKIDSIYFENNEYWKYILKSDSPFPISDEITSIENFKFTNEHQAIFKLMDETNIYAIAKTKEGLFLLIDGFTDNSFGYYFSTLGNMEMDNHLFQIQQKIRLTENVFYYVAN